MKKILFTTLITILLSPSFARAECLEDYYNRLTAWANDRDSHVGTWNDRAITSRYERDQTGQMAVVADMITSLGIPNIIGTSQYSTAASMYKETYAVYSLLKEANIGGGINLMSFVEDIRSEKKSLSSIDVESVASTIRDASNKNYFCVSGLANYAQVKKIVIGLVSP